MKQLLSHKKVFIVAAIALFPILLYVFRFQALAGIGGFLVIHDQLEPAEPYLPGEWRSDGASVPRGRVVCPRARTEDRHRANWWRIEDGVVGCQNEYIKLATATSSTEVAMRFSPNECALQGPDS